MADSSTTEQSMRDLMEQYYGRIAQLSVGLARGGRNIQIMEVCGTHTMAIARSGMRQRLPKNLRLVSGPGCPVCVTDQSYMDQAVWLADAKGFAPPIIATYGDMVRVPGRVGSLGEARARGAAIEVVYSADQAVELAQRTPGRQVVFLAVGFETTAPGTALAVMRAKAQGLDNFSCLVAHKLVLPAMRVLLSDPDLQLDAFLCPGHVSVILGYDAYAPIVEQYRRPCVVAGFDALQVAKGVVVILEQLAGGKLEATSVYPAVSAGGNAAARELLAEVFEVTDARWRAIGTIPGSGLSLRGDYAAFDAARRFSVPEMESYELPGCRCGDVICGRTLPEECKLFGRRCTPLDPVGPCMVSSEGACAAAYKYGGFRFGRASAGRGDKQP